MLRVRTKLLLVVTACAVPAVVAVVLGAWQARESLYGQVRAQVDWAEQAFSAELDDVLSSAELAVRLAADESSLAGAVAQRRDGAPARVVRALRGVYREAVVVVAGRGGELVAVSDPGAAPSVGGSDALAPLWRGEPVTAAADLPGAGFRILVGHPLTQGGEVVGALVLALPFGARELDAIRWKLQADLALLLDGRRVAASSGGPAGEGGSPAEGVRFVRGEGRLAALNAFRPARLQAPGHTLTVVAVQDVTALRAGVVRALLERLALVGAAALAGVGLALVLARRIAGAVGRVAAAAEAVRAGRYERVKVLETQDELEALSRTFNEMVHGLEDRDRIRDTFGRYVSRQVAERLLGGAVNLGGEVLPVTVLFSDIRGFTGISERMDPAHLLEFLNEYFTAMVDTVLEHEGVVDKFMGDGMMAVFGAPTPRDDDALRAVKAALRMRATLADLNRRFEAKGQPLVRIGIGIHTGPVVAGNIGHVERKQYTVIGDSVNVASRLESLTKEYAADILVSEDTYARVRGRIEAEPLEEVRVKGRQQPLRIYRVLGLAAEAAAG